MLSNLQSQINSTSSNNLSIQNQSDSLENKIKDVESKKCDLNMQINLLNTEINNVQNVKGNLINSLNSAKNEFENKKLAHNDAVQKLNIIITESTDLIEYLNRIINTDAYSFVEVISMLYEAEQLRVFASANDAPKFLKLFEKSNDFYLDFRYRDGKYLVDIASESKSMQVFEELMNQNAKINGKHFLSIGNFGNTELAKKVALKLGPHYIDNVGNSTLMYCLANSFESIADNLIDSGANLNCKNLNGLTALLYYIDGKSYNLNYLVKLVNLGADFKAKDNSNNGVLHYLVKKFHNFANQDPECEGVKIQGNTLIITGNVVISCDLADFINNIKAKNFKPLKFFIDSGANINDQNNQGLTPFFLVCASKNVDLANRMLDDYGNKIDFTIKDSSGFGYLHWGIELSSTKILDKIIHEGASIDEQDNMGKTTLYWACEYNYADILMHLLNKGANAKIHAHDGLYPIHIAALRGFDKIINVLSDYCDVNQETSNNQKWTPIFGSVQEGHLKTLEVLLNKNAKLDTYIEPQHKSALSHAIVRKNLPVIKFLVENKVNINDSDGNGATPLYYSLGYCVSEDFNITKYLIENGADVKKTMTDGDSPMHMASYRANVKAMNLLVGNGVDINQKNENNVTPLNTLLKTTEIYQESGEKKPIDLNKKIDGIKFLLYKNARTDIQDVEDHDSLWYAENYCKDAVKLIENPNVFLLGYKIPQEYE